MDSILSRYFSGLRHKKIAVLGLGVSNRPLMRLLLRYGCQALGCDRTPYEQLDSAVLELEKQGATLHVGETYLDDVEADLVFRTPGMHPANPALQKLQAGGAAVTSEMEVFFELCPCPILAVTGSDGKTTTTTLIAKMLEQAGKKVWLGGNIGVPLLPMTDEMAKEDYAVVELSSFQLMDMKRSAQIAVVTNLAPNHLDVHKDMAEYVEAKRNICNFQGAGDILVVNLDNEIANSFKTAGSLRQFSRQSRPENGVFLENGMIYRKRGEQIEAVLAQKDILLPGIHNVENYMAAIAAVEGIVPDEAVRQVAKTFGGVEHRIELVRVKDGVRYYNDSIASSPSRTIAGLRSFDRKVILIAGGYDKHIPYEVLGPEICEHVKFLVLTGATGEKIKDAVLQAEGEKPQIVQIEAFSDAVKTAAAAAKPGDTVLLSPASASFDRFKNFMERGNYFKELVQKL